MKFIKLAVLLIGVLRADNSVFRTDLSLIRVDARVTKAGALLNGLDASSFRIEDEGMVQPIVQCSLDQQKLDVVLLFDVSSSMGPSIRQVALTADRALKELY